MMMGQPYDGLGQFQIYICDLEKGSQNSSHFAAQYSTAEDICASKLGFRRDCVVGCGTCLYVFGYTKKYNVATHGAIFRVFKVIMKL